MSRTAERAQVLLVDDDPEIRLIAGFLLRSAGYSVAEADTAAAAAACMRDAPADILLVDLMLGTEDGVTVAAELMQDAVRTPALIFLTGATRADQVARMKATGAAGIVHKPFDPETFVSTVRALAGHA